MVGFHSSAARCGTFSSSVYLSISAFDARHRGEVLQIFGRQVLAVTGMVGAAGADPAAGHPTC